MRLSNQPPRHTFESRVFYLRGTGKGEPTMDTCNEPACPCVCLTHDKMGGNEAEAEGQTLLNSHKMILREYAI